MSREFPDMLDPWKAAEGRRAFRGSMPLNAMDRLLPLLAEGGTKVQPVMEASFSAQFGFDEQGLLTIRLEVSADLPLLCQRSLEPYIEKVSRRSLLTVIERVDDQDDVPERYDPILVENGRLALRDVVEEELLLAIPQVPRNPDIAEIEQSTDGAPVRPAEEENEKTHRPFAGLEGLMKAGTD